MMNEDIIKGLTLMRKNFDSNSVYGSYCIDCLDAAIEALKEQQEHSKNTSSKQPDLETLGIKTGETCEDVISRQQAVKVILADKIVGKTLIVMNALGDGRLALTLNDACDRHIRDIEKLPSAEPEVIRCKDCKHSEHWYRDKARCFLWHEQGIDVFEDGYCNYAERKEGDTDG
jgi:hypothetical protein